MMNKPVQEALALLHRIGWSQPSDMSVEEIAWSCGLIVKFKEMDGSQGRILMNDREGIIAINRDITFQPKINYIISHEIGHAHMHRNSQLFSDNDRTLSEWYSSGPQEAEANRFAAELLMPHVLFRSQVAGRKLELSLIAGVAEYFGASKTATFLRYAELGDFPIMVIFIENGIIKWKRPSSDFPYQWMENGTALPPFTVAGDLHYHGIKENKPEKVDAIEWFPDDFQCQYDKNAKLWEQCYRAGPSGILTCLWPAKFK